MATFLDIGLFQYFNVIFPVMLIFAVLFALLHKTKILGVNPTINAIIAVSIALMSLLSRNLIDLINFMAPWFVLALIFVVLLLLIYQTLGATEQDILGALKREKTIQWTVIGIGLLILLAGLGNILGQRVLPYTQEAGDNLTTAEMPGTTSSDWEQNMVSILFNPKILGIIFIFLIAIFTVAFLAGG